MRDKYRVAKKGKSISKSTVCTYLNNILRKPRKIKKVFALSDKNKGNRGKYCQKLINNGILGKNIFFTYETQIKRSFEK